MRKPWSEIIVVRPLSHADVEAAAHLEKNVFSPWSSSLIEVELDNTRSLAFTARAATEVVGWCACRYLQDEAELLKIGVAEKWRRRSVATCLLAALEKGLRDVGVVRLYLEVRSENLPAVSFYHQSGFTVTGRRINYYSQPSDDALVLQKNIFLI
ncbi:MAG: ribosomal protein S18-alanine N-acetyltransferase [Desulfofustis sp.]